jgi:hypothetical protein
MSFFAARPHLSSTLTSDDLVPTGFEALSDALDGAGVVTEVVAEIGRRAARDGEPIDELLAGLASTYQSVGGVLAEPPFEVVRALTGAWADASLRYLHAVSCEDPLTGLASLAHVRTRILEIYRESGRTGTPTPPHYALLVVELKWPGQESLPFDRLLRLIDIAEIIRTVYDGEETVGQLSGNRAVAIVRRDERIGDSIAGLLGLLQEWQDRTTIGTRLWIEGLPASSDAVEVLLDELAR